MHQRGRYEVYQQRIYVLSKNNKKKKSFLISNQNFQF